MNTAFVNGEFLPLAKARVSVLDRGFLFADSVYEVAPFYAGRGFRLDEHLDRLARSLELLRIRDPYDRPRWHGIIAGLIDANGGGDLSTLLQATTRAAYARAVELR